MQMFIWLTKYDTVYIRSGYLVNARSSWRGPNGIRAESVHG